MTAQVHNQTRSAIVAGGGIAGLTAAICLARQQFEVIVFEKAPLIDDIGAGVQISPNGSRVLEAIGVLQELKQNWFEPEALEMRHGKSGRQFLRLPMRQKAVDRWGGRYLQVYRPDLIDALIRVTGQYANIQIHTGTTVESYMQDRTEVVASVANPESLHTGSLRRADLLVAADGVHSRLRTQVVKDTPAQFTGNVAWRAVVPLAQLEQQAPNVDLPPPTACVWTGEGRHAVTTRVAGGKMINFVGVVEQESWQQEGWRMRGSHEEALSDFGDWNPTITSIINTAEELYRWALLERPALPLWSDNRAVLIGDAAHAMLPSMAQGAVQAIEDAWVLAECHAESHDITEANHRFFTRRIGRTRRVQQESAANLRLFHHRNAARQWLHYTPIYLAGKLAPWAIYRRNDWLYGGGPV